MTANDVADQGKAGFDHVYNRDDPREYFQALRPLSYQIPQHGNAVFAALLGARVAASTSQGPSSVLDVCCSYGVNAALLRCDLTLEDLFNRYGDSSLRGLSSQELASADRAFYADRRRPDAPRMLGLDVADRAIAYACHVGLLDAGWAENLETSVPSAALAEAVGNVDLITITGGVGYITERTFDQLLGAFPVGRKPWVAAFVLRMYPYDRIAETLTQHGLVTEQLPDTTFPQRRFASADEQSTALQGVRARGVDTRGKEEDGWYHCDLFVSRPQAEADERPLHEVLSPAVARATSGGRPR